MSCALPIVGASAATGDSTNQGFLHRIFGYFLPDSGATQLPTGVLLQTTAVIPVSPRELPRQKRLSPLAERASAGFSVVAASKGGAALQKIRRRVGGSVTDFTENVLPVCGQAAELNTFGCWDLTTGEVLADIPLPGQVTTVPQYFEGSWFVGTSRGFFIRMEANGPFLTPSFGIDSQLFHGPDARSTMKALARGSLSRSSGTQDFVSRFQGSWKWFATANAEFVGTPQFGNKQVFAVTANQSLNAYELDTGKLNWSVRIAPEAQLRLDTTSLLLTERGLLVGTSDGYLLLIDSTSGQIKWRHTLTTRPTDRFTAVVGTPLLVGNSVIVSNAESVTQRVNLDSKAVEWSYPVGSVTQPKYDEGFVYIAGSDGTLSKIDLLKGERAWRSSKLSNDVLTSLTLQKMHSIAILADAAGQLFVLPMNGPHAGKLVSRGEAANFGAVVGDFFAGRANLNEVCLSYRTPAVKCWNWIPAVSKNVLR